MLALKDGINIIIQDVKPEIPEDEGGCLGCFLWIVGIGLAIWGGLKLWNLIIEHIFATIIIVFVIGFVIYKIKK